MAASVAGAVAELARAGLLPAEHVPRWRDWLLDVLCVEGPEAGEAAVAAAGAAAAVAAGGGTGAGGGGGGGSGAAVQQQQQRGVSPPRAHAAGRPQRMQQQQQQQQQQQEAGASGRVGGREPGRHVSLPSWMSIPLPQQTGASSGGGVGGGEDTGAEGPSAAGGGGGGGVAREWRRGVSAAAAAAAAPSSDAELVRLRGAVVAALAALSQMPGNHGLQVCWVVPGAVWCAGAGCGSRVVSGRVLTGI